MEESYTKPPYCPCCSNTGKITASEKQTRERWEKMRIERPEMFKKVFNSGKVKLKNDKVVGITAVFACGCCEVDISTADDKKAGKSSVLAAFTTYFKEVDDKCMADSECNPFPGTGKCLCSKGYKYYKAVQDHLTNEIKDDPHYKKYMERLAERGSNRVKGTNFERVGADIDVNKVISEAGNDSQDRSRNYTG